MNGPRIQTDERGITINKTLAWTMVVALISASILAGREFQKTQSSITALADTQTQRHNETLTFRRDTENRIRSLEAARATDGSEIGALRRDLTSFRSDIQELKQLLRSLERSLVQP